MNYIKRQTFCECLAVNIQQSYRLIGRGQYGALISSDVVLEILNRARRGGIGIVRDIPSDIETAEQLVADPAFEGSDISAHDLVVWSQRKRNPLPHYRINKQIRRFRREAVLEWIRSRAITRRAGK